MSLKEMNRLRIERLTERYNARRDRGHDATGARAAFDSAFVRARESLLLPLFEDIGAELRRAGHDYVVEIDGHAKKPSVVFHVKLTGAKPLNANAMLFFVQHDPREPKSEIVVELSLNVDFELGRYAEAAAMTRTALEQMVVDGLEHMIVCNQG